jgi:hypothetical protein
MIISRYALKTMTKFNIYSKTNKTSKEMGLGIYFFNIMENIYTLVLKPQPYLRENTADQE